MMVVKMMMMMILNLLVRNLFFVCVVSSVCVYSLCLIFGRGGIVLSTTRRMRAKKRTAKRTVICYLVMRDLL